MSSFLGTIFGVNKFEQRVSRSKFGAKHEKGKRHVKIKPEMQRGFWCRLSRQGGFLLGVAFCLRLQPDYTRSM